MLQHRSGPLALGRLATMRPLASLGQPQTADMAPRPLSASSRTPATVAGEQGSPSRARSRLLSSEFRRSGCASRPPSASRRGFRQAGAPLSSWPPSLGSQGSLRATVRRTVERTAALPRREQRAVRAGFRLHLRGLPCEGAGFPEVHRHAPLRAPWVPAMGVKCLRRPKTRRTVGRLWRAVSPADGCSVTRPGCSTRRASRARRRRSRAGT